MSWLSDEIVASSSGNFTVPSNLQVSGNIDVNTNAVVDGKMAVGTSLSNAITLNVCGLGGAAADPAVAISASAANSFPTTTSYITGLSGYLLTKARATASNSAGAICVDSGATFGTNHSATRALNYRIQGMTSTNYAAIADNLTYTGQNFINQTGANPSTLTGGIQPTSALTVTAYAGGGSVSATAIASQFNIVTTCATHLDSVKLPTTIAGSIIIKNAGAKDCAVFPSAGGQIDALGADVAYPLAAGSTQEFVKMSTAQWYTKNHGQRYVPLTAVGFLDQTNATMDNSFAEVNVASAVPPSGRGLVGFTVYISDNTAGSYIVLRQKGTNAPATVTVTNPSVNGFVRSFAQVPADGNGVVEYRISEALAGLYVGVIGYSVEG